MNANSKFRLNKAREILGGMIVKEVDRRRLRQADAARMVGCTRQQMCHVYNGEVDNFSIEFLVAVALNLGLNIVLTPFDLDEEEETRQQVLARKSLSLTE